MGLQGVLIGSPGRKITVAWHNSPSNPQARSLLEATGKSSYRIARSCKPSGGALYGLAPYFCKQTALICHSTIMHTIIRLSGAATGLSKFGWERHNGETFGRQELHDDNVHITTSYLKQFHPGCRGTQLQLNASASTLSPVWIAAIIDYILVDEGQEDRRRGPSQNKWKRQVTQDCWIGL